MSVSIKKAFVGGFWDLALQRQKFEETRQDGIHGIRKDGCSGIGKRLADDLSVEQRWRAIRSERQFLEIKIEVHRKTRKL